MTERQQSHIPRPTPWHKTKNGETLLSVVCCGVVAGAYYAMGHLSGLAAEAAAFTGFVGLLLAIFFSGRASEKAVEDIING